MNSIHLEQIFANYIEKFEWLNEPTGNNEVYKWRIAQGFRPKMDAALDASDAVLPKKLYELRRFTENMIDSYTQPFTGLSKFAEQEPETVRQMFRGLYADDGGDLDKRQEKVEVFLRQSHALRDKYFPDSFLYNDDFHSVTSYLALYDPDDNYIYKATQALRFADCVEFYDDWGAGDHTKLKVYYRMCDWVAQEILKNEAVLKTDASRFAANPEGTLHPDRNKHILTFDLIYCCSVYGLFHGITFEHPNSKEKQLYIERKKKAEELAAKLSKAREEVAMLADAKQCIMSLMGAGSVVLSKAFGEGTVLENTGEIISVQVKSSGEIKKFGLAISVCNKLLSSAEASFSETISHCIPVLRRESFINRAVEDAEKALKPYIEYLE